MHRGPETARGPSRDGCIPANREEVTLYCDGRSPGTVTAPRSRAGSMPRHLERPGLVRYVHLGERIIERSRNDQPGGGMEPFSGRRRELALS